MIGTYMTEFYDDCRNYCYLSSLSSMTRPKKLVHSELTTISMKSESHFLTQGFALKHFSSLSWHS